MPFLKQLSSCFLASIVEMAYVERSFLLVGISDSFVRQSSWICSVCLFRHLMDCEFKSLAGSCIAVCEYSQTFLLGSGGLMIRDCPRDPLGPDTV